MDVFKLVALIFAFVFFVLAAFNVPSRWSLGWAGLACWVATIIPGLIH